MDIRNDRGMELKKVENFVVKASEETEGDTRE